MLNTTSASLAKALTSANSWRTPSNFFGKISSTNSSIKAKATSDLALISRAVEFSSTPISFNNALIAALSVSSAEKLAEALTPFNAATSNCFNSLFIINTSGLS